MPKIVPVHYKKLAKFFEARGFVLKRQKGDHLMYMRQGLSRPVVIPTYGKVPVFIIMNNLNTAGISRKEYFEEVG